MPQAPTQVLRKPLKGAFKKTKFCKLVLQSGFDDVEFVKILCETSCALWLCVEKGVKKNSNSLSLSSPPFPQFILPNKRFISSFLTVVGISASLHAEARTFPSNAQKQEEHYVLIHSIHAIGFR